MRVAVFTETPSNYAGVHLVCAADKTICSHKAERLDVLEEFPAAKVKNKCGDL